MITRLVLLVATLFFSFPAFCEEHEETQTPIYVLAPEIQSDFLPTPFPKKDISWDFKSGRNLIIDKKEGLILFISGRLKNSNLYLSDFKLPTDHQNFQFYLSLTTDSGSFLFTLEDKTGDRVTYKLKYFWLKYPSTDSNILIKDEDKITEKKMDRKASFNSREWLVFSWEKASNTVSPQIIFNRVQNYGYFKAFSLSGIAHFQNNESRLYSGKIAYTPFVDFNPLGVQLELGFSPLKSIDGKYFAAINYQLFLRLTLWEKNIIQAGAGGMTFTGESAGTAADVSFLLKRTTNFLPFQNAIFAGYSMFLFNPVIQQIQQFQLGLEFVF